MSSFKSVMPNLEKLLILGNGFWLVNCPMIFPVNIFVPEINENQN